MINNKLNELETELGAKGTNLIDTQYIMFHFLYIKKVYPNQWDMIIQELTSENITETIENVINIIKNDFITFEMVDLNDKRLAISKNERDEIIRMLIETVQSFDVSDTADVLGSVFEYILHDVMNGGGSSTGSFYTPACITRLMAQISDDSGKADLSIYDPTSGSGMGLISTIDEIGKDRIAKVTGQDINYQPTVLSKMNMIFNGIEPEKINISNNNTLLKSSVPIDERFDIIVANPPYGVKYGRDEVIALDSPIFNDVKKLPAKDKGELLFFHHMRHHISDDGTIVAVLPKGCLFRSGAEQLMRKTYIENNQIDTIVYLPGKIFKGTTIEATIVIMKKQRKESRKGFVKYIDAREMGTETDGLVTLSDDEINIISNLYKTDEQMENSHNVPIEKFKESDYDYDINTYVRRKRPDVIPLSDALKKMNDSFKILTDNTNKINELIGNVGEK